MTKKSFPLITAIGFILLFFGLYTYFNSALFVQWFGSVLGAVQYSDLSKDEIRNNIYVPLYGSVICESGATAAEPQPIYITSSKAGKGLLWTEKQYTFSQFEQVEYDDFTVWCYGAKNTAHYWGATLEIWKNDNLVARLHKIYEFGKAGREGDKSCGTFFGVPVACELKNFSFNASFYRPVKLISSDTLKLRVVCYQSDAPYTYADDDFTFSRIQTDGSTETLNLQLESSVSGAVTKAWVLYNHEGVKQPSPSSYARCPTSTVRQIVALDKQPAKGEEQELPKEQKLMDVVTGFFKIPTRDFYDESKYERFYYASVGEGFMFVEDWKKLEAPELVVLNYNGEAVIGRRTPYGNELWRIEEITTISGRKYYVPKTRIGEVECLDNSDCKGNFYCSKNFKCENVQGQCITDFDCSHGQGIKQYVWNGTGWDLIDYSGTCVNSICNAPKTVASNLKCNPTMPNACPLNYHCDPQRGCVPDNVKLYCMDNECCFGNGYLNPHDCPEGMKCYKAYDSDRGICVPKNDNFDEQCNFNGVIDKGENCENCAHDIEAVIGEGYCRKPVPKGKYELLGLMMASIGFVVMIGGIWKEF